MQNIPETIRWLEEGGFIERTADDRYVLTDLGVYIGMMLEREELIEWPHVRSSASVGGPVTFATGERDTPESASDE
jgi:hypothetical protein